MKTPSIPFLFSCALCVSSSAAAYQWPNPQYEALEKLLWEGSRLDGLSLSDSASNCKNRGGKSNAGNVGAEWVRFAFHDASTHNIDQKTGGLDASLFYELPRSENVGQGMKDTAAEFLQFAGKYISRADVVALGTIFGITSCGGLNIVPFRGGRLDAVVAGPPGVPEVHTNLADTTEKFRLMGFSAAEMIVLTACGHTIGGVRSSDFPDIVAPPPGSNDVVFQNFDTTPQFDLKVATEFLDGTTRNPLVVHPNITIRSDERIFNSDGGATLKTLRNATDRGFKIACKFGLLKMIDTVPATTTLTEPINLLPAKVIEPQITVENHRLVFKVDFRLIQAIGSAAPTGRTVTLHWCDKRGLTENCRFSMNTAKFASKSQPKYSPVTEQQGFYFHQYSFRVPVDPLRSIGKFWFIVNENNGTAPTTYSNEGAFYQMAQDNVIFVPSMSKSKSSTVHELVVGVRFPLVPSKVFVKTYEIAKSNTQLPIQSTANLRLDIFKLPLQGYSFYSGDVRASLDGTTIDIGATVFGDTYTQEYLSTSSIGSRPNILPPTSVGIIAPSVPSS